MSACRAFFFSSRIFLLSSAAFRRTREASSSRAMPMAILSRWNFAFGTPADSLASCARILSMACAGTANPNSPFAYKEISFLFSVPSLSLSYLSKREALFSHCFAALAFLTAFSLTALAAAVAVMMSLKQSARRCCSLMSSSRVGRTMSFACSMADRFFTINSVHDLHEAFASTQTSPTALLTSLASAGSSSLPSTAGAATSLSRAASFSAFSTSSANSAINFLEVSSCSLRIRSSSFMLSTRCFACSSCFSASSRIRSACCPHFGNSMSKVSSTSFFSASKLSGVANLTFWMAFLAIKAECCSNRRLSSSSLRLLFSSSSLRRSSSSRCLRSASRRRSSSSCCCLITSICWRFRNSSCCWRSRSCMSNCCCCCWAWRKLCCAPAKPGCCWACGCCPKPSACASPGRFSECMLTTKVVSMGPS
mmetsp:Transcript_114694/g.370607  ORF Transcript_114694/g.370607 Transcript_114694/m.370607 type:complete len:423 (-) Transcript_114694:3149-4417(-)